jgi:predicted SprT family Zn-dependent metalloprotease
MLKKNAVTILFSILFLSLFCIPAWAGTDVADTFDINTEEVKNRKKGPPKFKLVRFTHQKHTQDYEISCGDCHHDASNQALDLKPGDSVQRCVECHTKLTKDKKNRKDIMVLENAMHDNCISCHKAFNKEQGDPKGMKGPAPASCGKCHIPLKTK